MKKFTLRVIQIGGTVVVTSVLIAGVVYSQHHTPTQPVTSAKATDGKKPVVVELVSETEPVSDNLKMIEFPKSKWGSGNLQFESAQAMPLNQQFKFTGKVNLNEDRLAHLSSLVEGRVDSVSVRLGQKVKQGETLVVIQSKEVGNGKLQLFQDRLKLSFAQVKDQWTQEVARNTLALVERIRANATIDEIETAFKDRTMGDFREKLMTAYVAFQSAEMHWKRLAPLSKEGAVSGRQAMEAESERDSTRAVLQALLEQVSQDARQDAQMSTQTVKEYQTNVAVSEANLKILGFTAKSLVNIDPTQQGEKLAHYDITAPFDGTVIKKDVVLLERVGPDSQIVTVADLSTVWITADVYETQMPLLAKIGEQPIRVMADAWPDQVFEAKVFSTGDVVQETTRTVMLRAIADNSKGYLRPGMFVTVEVPNLDTASVVQVPSSSLQEFEGKTFVFVHRQGDQFEKRMVTIGRKNQDRVEILSGVKAGEEVVVKGGFALKSKMLEGLLQEE